MKVATPYTDGTVITRDFSDPEEPALFRRYKCGSCGEEHDTEYEAEECCRPAVDEIYCCSVCEGQYDSSTEATGCCAEIKKERAGADWGRIVSVAVNPKEA